MIHYIISQYHSIIEEPNTVSFIVRGPIEKASFQVITEMQGKSNQKLTHFANPRREKTKNHDAWGLSKSAYHLLFLKII